MQQSPFATPVLGGGVFGGLIPTRPDLYARVYPYPIPRLNPQAVLQNHDLRDYQGQSLFPPIGDQGQIGSCAAWAYGYYLRSALASKWHIDNGTTPDLPDTLSPRFLYDATRGKMGTYPQDSGSDMRTAASILLDYGCAAERDCPYTGKADNGPLADEMTEHVRGSASYYAVSNYYKIQGTGQALIDNIIATLHQNQPVALAILIEERFINAPGGKVPAPDPNAQILGGHAICCCGNFYDNSASGGIWLPILNSWGPSAGDGGVYYIPSSYATTQHRYYGSYLQEAWTCV